jgi:cobalt-zinc-cadmium efflux system membrane fusion protein
MKNIVLIILSIWAFYACENGPEHQELLVSEEAENGLLSADQLALAGIETGKIAWKKMGAYIQTTGLIDVPPSSLASVYCATAGFIQSTRFLPGDLVRKGQILATVTHPDIIAIQKEFLMTHFQFEQLKKEWERQKSLLDKGAGSEKAYDVAYAGYKMEKVHLEGLEKELFLLGLNPEKLVESETISNTLNIVAPITGYVNVVNVNLGKLIDPNDLLYQIIDIDHIHLEIDIFSKDLPFIQKGQHFKAYMAGLDSIYEGEVYLVGQAIDSGTNKAKIHGHFHNEPVLIAPGTFMKVEIQTEEKEVMTLPEGAVVEDAGEYFVFLVKGGQYEKIKVETGLTDDGSIEILGDSTMTNQTFVTKGAYYIEGMMVAEE